MNVRRLYAPVVLALLATGGLAFYALGRTWGSSRIASDGLPSDTVKVTGSDAYPLASALALVVVTAALAVLASSPRVRRGVGVFTVIVAGGALVALLDGRGGLEGALSDAVKKSPAFTGGPSGSGQSYTSWDLVAMAAFFLAALLGALVAWFGARWPAMSSRYDGPAARDRAAAPQSDTDMWKAMDDGRDPTQ